MRLVDTHCHLTEPPLADDVEGVLARARAAGVADVVAPAYDRASWPRVAALGGRPGVHLAFGLHPWVADQGLDAGELAATLRRLLREHAAVAVGEIGLDGKIDGADLRAQVAVLRPQLAVARELDLPVLLHCRGAFEELLALLPDYPSLRGIVHAYTRGPELGARFLDLGLHLAYGGAATRPGARRTHASVRATPADRLLLETDAPSIGLDGVPADRVEPRHVREIAAAVAGLRGATPAQVADLTTANARALLRLGAGGPG